MANNSNLIEDIVQNIRTNGNNEITGAKLQSVLLRMVDDLGTNPQFMGVAVPATDPGTPDGNVFYLASVQGTYTHFGNITVPKGALYVLRYDNGEWTYEDTGVSSFTVDAVLRLAATEAKSSNNATKITALEGWKESLDGTMLPDSLVINADADSVDLELDGQRADGIAASSLFGTIPAATSTKAGVMAAADKAKLGTLRRQYVYPLEKVEALTTSSSAAAVAAAFTPEGETGMRIPSAGDILRRTHGQVVDDNDSGLFTAVEDALNGKATVSYTADDGGSVVTLKLTNATAVSQYDKVKSREVRDIAHPFRQLYVDAGAVYNEATGYYELNGLTDITEEQMKKIYFNTNRWWENHIGPILAVRDVRTNIPAPYYSLTYYNQFNFDFFLSFAENMEVVKFSVRNDDPYRMISAGPVYQNANSSMGILFSGCKSLKAVLDPIRVDNLTSGEPIYAIDSRCTLETVYFHNIKGARRISLNLPKLSAESVRYMIENEILTTDACVIRLHADALARAQADEGVQAALAAHPKITLEDYAVQAAGDVPVTDGPEIFD